MKLGLLADTTIGQDTEHPDILWAPLIHGSRPIFPSPPFGPWYRHKRDSAIPGPCVPHEVDKTESLSSQPQLLEVKVRLRPLDTGQSRARPGTAGYIPSFCRSCTSECMICNAVLICDRRKFSNWSTAMHSRWLCWLNEQQATTRIIFPDVLSPDYPV